MGENSSAAACIHLVQHLIEKCLIWRLTKEETMEALSKHANINPIVSCTVWNELEKENMVFFKEYSSRFQTKEEEKGILPEKETNQILQKLISNSSGNSDDNVNA